jgi:hypothetical protein
MSTEIPRLSTVRECTIQPTAIGAVEPRRRLSATDWVSLGALILLAVIVHPLAAFLRTPYWLDEAWAALSTKAPLAELPWVTGSTPLGWTTLLRLIPPGAQQHRLIPYAFLIGSVVLAYLLGRGLGWRTKEFGWLAGSIGAVAVLLFPAHVLALKQYTADGTLSLGLLTTLAWVEAHWSWRRVSVLGVAAVAGMLFSHASALVGVAVFTGLLASVVVRRTWTRLPVILLVGTLTVCGMLAVYLIVNAAGRTGPLDDYWAPLFPSLNSLPTFVLARLRALEPIFGLPWPLFLILGAAGVVTIAYLSRLSTAVAAASLPLGALLAGVMDLYPLLDQRTSNFLFVVCAALAGIGIAGLTLLLARPIRNVRHRTVAAGVLSASALAWFTSVNAEMIYHHSPPGRGAEDVVSQIRYIETYVSAEDVILVNYPGAYAFAYYWSRDTPQFVRGEQWGPGWLVHYELHDSITVAQGRDPRSITEALARARARAAPEGRVWIVRSHVAPSERLAWDDALAGSTVETIDVGREPLCLLEN